MIHQNSCFILKGAQDSARRAYQDARKGIVTVEEKPSFTIKPPMPSDTLRQLCASQIGLMEYVFAHGPVRGKEIPTGNYANSVAVTAILGKLLKKGLLDREVDGKSFKWFISSKGEKCLEADGLYEAVAKK